MTTKLEKAIKREVLLNGVAFTVTMAPEGLRIVEKGKRKGHDLSWEQLIRGDVNLTQDLKDSVDVARESTSPE